MRRIRQYIYKSGLNENGIGYVNGYRISPYSILFKANLEGEDLQGANLYSAHLDEANLKGANLRNANLWWANLRNADLRDADLRDADLRSADFTGAHIEGMDIRGANLLNTYINTRNLEKIILDTQSYIPQENEMCSICFENLDESAVMTKCNHKFHANCLLDWKKTGAVTCPMCRTKHTFFGKKRSKRKQSRKRKKRGKKMKRRFSVKKRKKKKEI